MGIDTSILRIILNKMKERKDLIGYDFQGWPIFKQNLREILLNLGGKVENNKLVFDLDNPYLKAYPRTLIDDGMGYGINKSYITEVSCFKDNGKPIVNLFIELAPTRKQKRVLLDRWDKEIALVENIIERHGSGR